MKTSTQTIGPLDDNILISYHQACKIKGRIRPETMLIIDRSKGLYLSLGADELSVLRQFMERHQIGLSRGTGITKK